MFKNSYKSYLLIFSLALVALAFAMQWYFQKRDHDFVRITVFAKKTLHEEEQRSNRYVEWLGNMLSRQTNYSAIDDSLIRSAQRPLSEFYCFVYHNDSLIYWDNNAVSFSYQQVKNGINQQLIQLKNGWYELFRYQRRSISIIGLLPIRTGYEFQNKYLRNEFNPVFKLTDSGHLSRYQFKRKLYFQHKVQSRTGRSGKTVVHCFCFPCGLFIFTYSGLFIRQTVAEPISFAFIFDDQFFGVCKMADAEFPLS